MNGSTGWSGRQGHTSVVLQDGSILLMGGFTWGDIGTDIGNKNDIWRSIDNGTTWSLMNESAGWSGRLGHTSVVMPDGSIVLMGGNSGEGNTNDVWRSADIGATWDADKWECRMVWPGRAHECGHARW